MFTEWGNDVLLWLCINFMYGWPVCSSKYFSRCSSVCFFFCWSVLLNTKRTNKAQPSAQTLYRAVFMMHIMFVRYGRPKIDVHYTYYLSTHCFFTDYSDGILMVFWWYLSQNSYIYQCIWSRILLYIHTLWNTVSVDLLGVYMHFTGQWHSRFWPFFPFEKSTVLHRFF